MQKLHFLPDKDYTGLNDDFLKPGDIVLTRGDNRISKLIQKSTQSKFSHASLILGRNVFIEATSEGVSIKNTNRIIVDSPKDICILRYNNLSLEQFEKINFFCRNDAFSCKYNLKGILVPFIDKFIKDKFYCSQLIYVAYKIARITLCPIGAKIKGIISPGDLYNSPLLTPVKNCCIQLSKDFINNIPPDFFDDYQIKVVTNFLVKSKKMLKQYDIKINKLNDILVLPSLVGTEIDRTLYYTKIDKLLCDIFDETRYGYIHEDYVFNNSEASKGSWYMAYNLPINVIQKIGKSYEYNAYRHRENYNAIFINNSIINCEFYNKLMEMYKRNYDNCIKYYKVCKEAETIRSSLLAVCHPLHI